jgi:hypothetical protein
VSDSWWSNNYLKVWLIMTSSLLYLTLYLHSKAQETLFFKYYTSCYRIWWTPQDTTWCLRAPFHGWDNLPPDPTGGFHKVTWSVKAGAGIWNQVCLTLNIFLPCGYLNPIDELITYKMIGGTKSEQWQIYSYSLPLPHAMLTLVLNSVHLQFC